MKIRLATTYSLILRFIFTFILLMFLCGCAATGRLVYNPSDDTSIEHALSFQPPSGQSGIYIIRESHFMGGGFMLPIYLDLEPIGKLGKEQYIYIIVPPGTHGVTTTPLSDMCKFQTEPNKNYYITV